MKKVMFIMLSLCMVASVAVAQDAAQVEAPVADQAAEVAEAPMAEAPVAEMPAVEAVADAAAPVADVAAEVATEVAPVAEAVAETVAPATDVVTLTGVIIDNMCAESQEPAALEAFVATHTKECALECAATGFAVYADGKLTKVTADSNAKVEEFLAKPESALQAVVTGTMVGEELAVESIQ